MKKCELCNEKEIKLKEKYCPPCKQIQIRKSEQKYRDSKKEEREFARRKEFEDNFYFINPSQKELVPKEFNKLSKLSSSSYRKHYKMNWAETLNHFNKKTEYENYIIEQYKKFIAETGKQNIAAFAKYVGLTYPLLEELDMEKIREQVGIEKKRNTEQDLIDNFNMVKEKVGSAPLHKEFLEHSKISIQSYRMRHKLDGKVYDEIVREYTNDDEFGIYQIRRLAHKSQTGRVNHQGEKYTLQELEDEFKRVYDDHIEKYGKNPSRRVFNSLSKFDDSLYRNRLGMTFMEILEGYGYEPDYSNTKSEKMVVAMIESIVQEEAISQAKFDWLMSPKGYPLKCDGYFINNNFIVEFDGVQHSKVIEHWGGEDGLRMNQIHDAIKNKLIPEHGITLIRIPYDEPYWDREYITNKLIEHGIKIPNLEKVS